MQTLHQASTILDQFVSNCSFKKFTRDELEIYAVVSLMIAAKMIEKDDRIPKSGMLLKNLSSHLKYSEISQGCVSARLVKTEREILKANNWNTENFPYFYSIVEVF